MKKLKIKHKCAVIWFNGRNLEVIDGEIEIEDDEVELAKKQPWIQQEGKANGGSDNAPGNLRGDDHGASSARVPVAAKGSEDRGKKAGP